MNAFKRIFDKLDLHVLYVTAGVVAVAGSGGLLLHAHVKQWYIRSSKFYRDALKLFHQNKAAVELLGVPVEVRGIGRVAMTWDRNNVFYTVRVIGCKQHGEVHVYAKSTDGKHDFSLEAMDMYLSGNLKDTKFIIYRKPDK